MKNPPLSRFDASKLRTLVAGKSGWMFDAFDGCDPVY